MKSFPKTLEVFFETPEPNKAIPSVKKLILRFAEDVLAVNNVVSSKLTVSFKVEDDERKTQGFLVTISTDAVGVAGKIADFASDLSNNGVARYYVLAINYICSPVKGIPQKAFVYALRGLGVSPASSG